MIRGLFETFRSALPMFSILFGVKLGFRLMENLAAHKPALYGMGDDAVVATKISAVFLSVMILIFLINFLPNRSART